MDKTEVLAKAKVLTNYLNTQFATSMTFGNSLSNEFSVYGDQHEDYVLDLINLYLCNISQEDQATFCIEVLDKVDKNLYEYVSTFFGTAWAEPIINTWHNNGHFILSNEIDLLSYHEESEDYILTVCKLIIPHLTEYQTTNANYFKKIIQYLYDGLYISYGDEEKDTLIELSKAIIERQYGHLLKKFENTKN